MEQLKDLDQMIWAVALQYRQYVSNRILKWTLNFNEIWWKEAGTVVVCERQPFCCVLHQSETGYRGLREDCEKWATISMCLCVALTCLPCMYVITLVLYALMQICLLLAPQNQHGSGQNAQARNHCVVSWWLFPSFIYSLCYYLKLQLHLE